MAIEHGKIATNVVIFFRLKRKRTEILFSGFISVFFSQSVPGYTVHTVFLKIFHCGCTQRRKKISCALHFGQRFSFLGAYEVSGQAKNGAVRGAGGVDFSGRGHLLFRSLLSIVLSARLPSKFPMRRHGASHNGGCSHADVYLRSAYCCGSGSVAGV